jgi:hypothetical protein
MADPLYLTDAERPLRPTSVRDRYRFAALFELKATRYTRWFSDPGQRAAYLANTPNILPLETWEGTSEQQHAEHRLILGAKVDI